MAGVSSEYKETHIHWRSQHRFGISSLVPLIIHPPKQALHFLEQHVGLGQFRRGAARCPRL